MTKPHCFLASSLLLGIYAYFSKISSCESHKVTACLKYWTGVMASPMSSVVDFGTRMKGREAEREHDIYNCSTF